MNPYKLIDFWIQVILISGSLIYCFLDPSFLLYAYFLVGGWQLLSCLFHAIYKGHYYEAGDRKYYLKALLWVFILGIVTIPVWLLYGFGLLFISPLLALWYTFICYHENKLLEHKSLIHLK